MSSQNEWRWRTPDEELPKPGQEVLCRVSGQKRMGRYVVEKFGGPRWRYEESDISVDPQHWMPLPPDPSA